MIKIEIYKCEGVTGLERGVGIGSTYTIANSIKYGSMCPLIPI